jgi:hypothetical protein
MTVSEMVETALDRNREWSLTIAADRTEREVALTLADAMVAAANHLKASASALRAEFGLPRDVRGSMLHNPKPNEQLVDHILSSLSLDLPVDWRAECVNCAPFAHEFEDDELDQLVGKLRERVQSFVKSLICDDA